MATELRSSPLSEILIAAWLTVKLATFTALILLCISVPIAWFLAFSKLKIKYVLEPLVSLPLLLPPTVLGFYVLMFLSDQGPFGTFYSLLNLPGLAFSFGGLLVGSVIYSLPFGVQPILTAFRQMGTQPLELAATLKASFWDRLFTVALPLAKQGLLLSFVLSFCHTIGEFGVVLMIGGNIPGQTKVLSLLMYDYVELMQFEQANTLALFLLVFAFVALLCLYQLQRKGMPR